MGGVRSSVPIAAEATVDPRSLSFRFTGHTSLVPGSDANREPVPRETNRPPIPSGGEIGPPAESQSEVEIDSIE